MALARHRELSMEDNLSLDSFPLRNERQDIFAIRHPYDYIRGSLSASSSEFSYNSAVRNNFLHLRFNQHAWEHRKTCFKKGDECRANLPSTTQDEFELDFDEEKDVNWPMVNCNDWSVFPFAVLPKRIFADQYLNVFNKHIYRISLAATTTFKLVTWPICFTILSMAAKVLREMTPDLFFMSVLILPKE